MSEIKGIEVELKKNSLRQAQSGDWTVSFTASPIDFPVELVQAGMGQRFMCVLVPLGDFEEPEPVKAHKPEPMEGHKDNNNVWVTRAVMACKDKRWWAFLREKVGLSIINEEQAVEALKALLNIQSRAELATKHTAREAWGKLHREYEAWLHYVP